MKNKVYSFLIYLMAVLVVVVGAGSGLYGVMVAPIPLHINSFAELVGIFGMGFGMGVFGMAMLGVIIGIAISLVVWVASFARNVREGQSVDEAFHKFARGHD